jgi:hypothetical protein
MKLTRLLAVLLLGLGLTLALMSVAAVQAASPDETHNNFVFGGPGGVPPTLIGISPPRNVITAALTTVITAAYDQPLAAASVTTRTLVAYGMQSGAVTAVPSLGDARTVRLAPAQGFHQGELVYAIATTSTTNLTGTAPLTATQWQFNAAAAVAPRCVAGFTDIGAGLPGLNVASVAWGDYDRDGDLDLLQIGRASCRERVLRNV